MNKSNIKAILEIITRYSLQVKRLLALFAALKECQRAGPGDLDNAHRSQCVQEDLDALRRIADLDRHERLGQVHDRRAHDRRIPRGARTEHGDLRRA